MKTAKRAWAFMFSLSDSAKTADGWRRATVHILALCAAAWAFHFAADASRRAIPFIAERGIFDILIGTVSVFLLVYALFSPAVYGLTFRLRAARGFAGRLAAVVMYAPIFGLALIGALSVHFAPQGGVADFDRLVSGNWVALMLIAGLIASAAVALNQRGGGEAPAPAVTASRFYAPTEAAVCVAALALMLLIARW